MRFNGNRSQRCFCDVDPDSHCIDPAKVASLITAQTSGIIGVHLWGSVCDVRVLQRIANTNDLALICDAAHALRCSHRGQAVGGFEIAEVFSFHATKFFNFFEGGAVVANDDQIAERMRLMRNFVFAGYDNVIYIGTNGKMSEAYAAMGLTSLESIDVFIERNQRNYATYQKHIDDIEEITLLSFLPCDMTNHQNVIAEIDENLYGLDRDTLMKVLHKENILVRRYFYLRCHRMEPYRTLFPQAGTRLPRPSASAAV